VGGHRHLQRLSQVWIEQPIYFITTCVAGRRKLLACEPVHSILRGEWQGLLPRHGWAVGQYVLMPEHVHFFVRPTPATSHSLSTTVGRWKEWTARRVLRELGEGPPLWQPEFFDYVIRSNKSQSEKWAYVRENPVRAGLVNQAEDWACAGFIDFE
jgi:REP element-mobilizing transposase RayT